tara:strand:- start:215 stop:475 length:261 start_codon:yes stop_codon:yes gene_type:complete
MINHLRILFFASLRDELGMGEIEIPASELTNTEHLLEVLEQHVSGFKMEFFSAIEIQIAVNQVLVDGFCDVKPGDEIALLPPVTGG